MSVRTPGRRPQIEERRRPPRSGGRRGASRNPSRIVAAAYVATVAGLTAYAFRPGADGFNTAEGVAAALTVPMVIAALPVIYVVGALAWDVADSESGDPTLLVTVTFTALMSAVAVANAWLSSWVWRGLRSRRAHSERRRAQRI